MASQPPLESVRFARRNIAITDHAFADTEKLRDKTLGDARAIESFGRLTMVVEIVHRKVKQHTVVTLIAFPSIPPTANARVAVGVRGRIPGPFALLPILTRVLSAEVADSLTLDIHTHGHRIVGIVILKYEASLNKPILTLVRTRAADRLKRLLVV